MGGRWFGVGHSDAEDGETAGAEAAAAALTGRRPALVIIFSQVREDLLKLAEGVRSVVSGDVTIVGTSTSGQYATGTTGTAGVVVAAYGGPGLEVHTRVGHGATGRCREAAAEAAGCVESLTLSHRVLMLLFDGLTGQQHEIIRGAYSVAGAAVPLVGGGSGDGLTFVGTYQVIGDAAGVEVLTDAIIGIALGCKTALGLGIAHGWRKVGEPMVVTNSLDGHIFELDGEPALDVYLRRIGADRALADDSAAFADTAMRHPLGLSRRGGEDIRYIYSGDPLERSLVCLADVPQGGLMWSMKTDEDALVDAAADSAAEAVAMLDGKAPVGLIGFDCAIRKLILADHGVERETAALATAAGPVPYSGWYTNGEIARVRGSRGLHHLTLVTLALS